jgi:ubiquinone/menaquinone biosynthesis C-methylase UbiE
MTAVDVGSAMGFFSLPLAELVGGTGRVVCIDLQEKMLKALERRARKADLRQRMDLRTCTATSLGIDDLAGTVDFALTFAMVHEVPDPDRLFAELAGALKPGGHLLLAEPAGHVGEKQFAETVEKAKRAGLSVETRPVISGSYAALLKKETRP